MRVLFDNCNFHSASGPNAFGTRLAKALSLRGHILADPGAADVQLSFIMMTQADAPVVLRLDGIYFNTDQDWESMNMGIRASYENASAVVAQSEFNRELLERYFGQHESMHVIHNGTDTQEIDGVLPLEASQLDSFDEIWACASSWRPHKRLSENIRYFQECAPSNSALVIAGGNPDARVSDSRVFYAGQLQRPELLSLYKRASTFLHLALLDHCPNVVVEARAAGCRIVCASSGGTKEIAGPEAEVIEDMEWDWQPFKLYNPPRLDFQKTVKALSSPSLDINDVAHKYEKVLASVASENLSVEPA